MTADQPRGSVRQQPHEGTTPAVVLRHDMPDGSHHFDLLISRTAAPASDDARDLIALRCEVNPLELVERRDPFEADRLPDHRALYLKFEGELAADPPGSRGSVRRVGEMRAVIQADGSTALRAVLTSPNGASLRLEAEAWPTGMWEVRIGILPRPGGEGGSTRSIETEGANGDSSAAM